MSSTHQYDKYLERQTMEYVRLLKAHDEIKDSYTVDPNEAIENNIRNNEIQNYFKHQYKSYTYFVIIFCIFIALFLFWFHLINIGLIPRQIGVWISLFYVLSVTIYFIGVYYDLSIRNSRDFEKYDFPGGKHGIITATDENNPIDEPEPNEPEKRSGPECCPELTTFNSSLNLCEIV